MAVLFLHRSRVSHCRFSRSRTRANTGHSPRVVPGAHDSVRARQKRDDVRLTTASTMNNKLRAAGRDEDDQTAMQKLKADLSKLGTIEFSANAIPKVQSATMRSVTEEKAALTEPYAARAKPKRPNAARLPKEEASTPTTSKETSKRNFGIKGQGGAKFAPRSRRNGK